MLPGTRAARKFDPQALVTNGPTLTAAQIIGYFLRHWQVEVTFAEVRAHLGMETQRQWSGPAIERTTPVPFGLFSLVALYAATTQAEAPLPVRRSAWYDKPEPTFSDLLVRLRRPLWLLPIKRTSSCDDEVVLIPHHLLRRWHDALVFAA